MASRYTGLYIRRGGISSTDTSPYSLETCPPFTGTESCIQTSHHFVFQSGLFWSLEAPGLHWGRSHCAMITVSVSRWEVRPPWNTVQYNHTEPHKHKSFVPTWAFILSRIYLTRCLGHLLLLQIICRLQIDRKKPKQILYYIWLKHNNIAYDHITVYLSNMCGNTLAQILKIKITWNWFAVVFTVL